MPAAEIRDHETGLVSGPFSWFQSRQLFLETHETEVVDMSSSFWLLALGSRDLSQAEKEITASKAEQIQKMKTIFTQSDHFFSNLTILIES